MTLTYHRLALNQELCKGAAFIHSVAQCSETSACNREIANLNLHFGFAL